MTFQEISHLCNLVGCTLTETDDTLHLEFNAITIELRKDFITGQTQLALFTASGWLPTFRQYINNQLNGTEGKEESR